MPKDYPEIRWATTREDQIVERILERLTYRPGWRFEIIHSMLTITAPVVDANQPDRMTSVMFSTSIPYGMNPDFDWVRWLFERVKNVEMHEMEEFFRIDGRPVYDPHPGDKV